MNDDEIKVSGQFGEYLKYLRNLRGLSILELARLSTVSPSYISRLEGGSRQSPKPDVLRKLAPHLGIGYSEMMVKAGYLTKNTEHLTIDDEETKELFVALTERKKDLLRTVHGFSEQTIKMLSETISQIRNDLQNRKK